MAEGARREPGARVVRSPDGDADTPVTTFEVWAPDAEAVDLHLHAPHDRVVAMRAVDAGWWTASCRGAGHGTRYRLVVDGGEPLPDPASAWQPDGVHGASAVVDTHDFGDGFAWGDAGWRGVRLDDAVVYELHVGAFTPAGTFDAAIGELARLAELGVTVLELMPVNAFPGERNWGYDGVFPFAVQDSYGGPGGLARLVDAAHAAGLGVVLDVVYNHVGPEGAVLSRFGPYFTDEHHTPWGAALNIAGPGSDAVRDTFVANARRWIRDFHVDGFRFDAVHAVVDPTANPFWEEIADAARTEARLARRTVLLIAESSDNDPRYVRPPERGGYGHDAVWNDDVHHCVRVALTGDRRGYYADYVGTADELADIVEHRWRFRGQHSVARGRRHGRPVDDVAPTRFVVCSQNHDQVGNRPAGERPRLDADRRRLAPSIVALLPSTPMLFMGEEYGETAPFPFFVDHRDPMVLEATRTGRRLEFADADWDVEVPDPGDPATFESARLDPSVVTVEPHRSLLAMYTELYRLRRAVPTVRSPAAAQRVFTAGTAVAVHRWIDGSSSTLLVNLGVEPSTVPPGWVRHADGGPPRVMFDSADARWGGPGGGVRIGPDGVRIAPWTGALVVS